MPLNQKGVGPLIRRMREERGMSREQLAKKAEVTYACIYATETGRSVGITTGTAYKIARAFRVPVFRLFMLEAEWAKFNGKLATAKPKAATAKPKDEKPKAEKPKSEEPATA